MISLINTLRHFRNFALRIKSKWYIRRLLKEREIINLEIGAGYKRGENEWITLDLNPKCDIYWDLKKGLPFPDESIHTIYSSHVFEHFAFKDIVNLLDECRRVLITGGIFSICVPDAQIWIAAYCKNEDLDVDLYCNYKPAFHNNSRIDYINYIAYMDGHHRYMFDRENLISILQKAQFRKVKLRDFDPDIDLEERRINSLYALAEK